MVSALHLSIFFFFLCITTVYSLPAVIDVTKLGARADGKTDNAKAFLNAWTQACGATQTTKLLIPAGRYLTGPVNFQGQCKNRVEVQLDGTIVAPADLYGIQDWINFKYITGFTLSGKGGFDGQGKLTWSQNQCKDKESGGKCKFPISVRFNFVNDAVISGISSVDSKLAHINVFGCKNIKLQHIKISAPAESLNTDGIHIGSSTGVEISHSNIATGDDCVSMVNGTSNVNVFDVTCGPGHGVAIGSMGGPNKENKEEIITNVAVRNCTFTGTDNGVRIKTWPAGVAGIARNLTFEDIIMNNVQNPVVIDQEYCPYNKCNKKIPSRIKISDVKFRNIRGTSATKEALILSCSKGAPCQGVELSDINLKFTGPGGVATSICANLKPVIAKNLIPATCGTKATI
ncbi:galacturonan 1,4-alpha-galacturonidase [Ranunculus cassubicifolius]